MCKLGLGKSLQSCIILGDIMSTSTNATRNNDNRIHGFLKCKDGRAFASCFGDFLELTDDKGEPKTIEFAGEIVNVGDITLAQLNQAIKAKTANVSISGEYTSGKGKKYRHINIG